MRVILYQPLTNVHLSAANKQIHPTSTTLQKAFFPIFPFSVNFALLTLFISFNLFFPHLNVFGMTSEIKQHGNKAPIRDLLSDTSRIQILAVMKMNSDTIQQGSDRNKQAYKNNCFHGKCLPSSELLDYCQKLNPNIFGCK